MTDHKTGTREEWLAARLELLEAEKALTRRSDELARQRQELPWVRIAKEYRFATGEGTASLADLFQGRSQLLIYHFMFGPGYTAGCPSCSAIADGFDGSVVHLANHDVTLCAVSRAPLAKLQAYQRRMGWSFPGRLRSAATSTTTSRRRSPRSSGNPEPSSTTSARRTFGCRKPARTTPSSPRSPRASERTGRPIGKKGPASARSRSRTASSTTPTRRTRAGSTASGACTSGSTARHSAATRPASGGAATTSTTASDACRTRRHRRVRRPARAGRRSPQPGRVPGIDQGQPRWC
jgi:hypothetical protein